MSYNVVTEKPCFHEQILELVVERNLHTHIQYYNADSSHQQDKNTTAAESQSTDSTYTIHTYT